jgi:hypothetical protein
VTEYSFRTEIVWPDNLPDLPQEVVDEMARKMEARFLAMMCPPQPDPLPRIVKRCCHGGILHAPNCEFWGVVT